MNNKLLRDAEARGVKGPLADNVDLSGENFINQTAREVPMDTLSKILDDTETYLARNPHLMNYPKFTDALIDRYINQRPLVFLTDSNYNIINKGPLSRSSWGLGGGRASHPMVLVNRHTQPAVLSHELGHLKQFQGHGKNFWKFKEWRASAQGLKDMERLGASERLLDEARKHRIRAYQTYYDAYHPATYLFRPSTNAAGNPHIVGEALPDLRFNYNILPTVSAPSAIANGNILSAGEK